MALEKRMLWGCSCGMMGLFIALGACSGKPGPVTSGKAGRDVLVVELQALGGSGVSGSIEFRSADGKGVQVVGEVRGLKPGSRHGFHIHEVGDCSAPDGTSAGGHFNPQKLKHGAPGAQVSHVGDLGNLLADANGTAKVDRDKESATLVEGTTAILGRAVVVHAQPDDLTSQPTGAAGARIACGVINKTIN